MKTALFVILATLTCIVDVRAEQPPWHKNYAGSICDAEYLYYEAGSYNKGYGRFNSLRDGMKVNCPLVMDEHPTPWAFEALVRLRNDSDQQQYVDCSLTVRDDDGQVVDQDWKSSIALQAMKKKWVDFFVSLDPTRRVEDGDILFLYCNLANSTSIQSIKTWGRFDV